MGKPFYNLETIKEVPILDVCREFDIELIQKGSTFWCKIRPERTASTKIYPENNTYYDFGDKNKGDTIALISNYFGVERGRAIGLIAEKFGISPENPRSGYTPVELTPTEYKAIGLDGMQASRNFIYNHERMSMEKAMELDFQYIMPMNVLKKTNPGTYARILKQTAIPYVRDLRRNYYSEVFSQYNLAKAVGCEEVFSHAVENGEFAAQIKELQRAEHVLRRACMGTKIDALPVGEYEPMSDLKKILSGEIKIDLGSKSYREMQTHSQEEKSPVKYQTVTMDGFLSQSAAMSSIAHSAFIKGENMVVVGYLEKDYGKLKSFFNKMRVPHKQSLNQKISKAEAQQKELSNQCSFALESKEIRKGEER